MYSLKPTIPHFLGIVTKFWPLLDRCAADVSTRLSSLRAACLGPTDSRGTFIFITAATSMDNSILLASRCGAGCYFWYLVSVHYLLICCGFRYELHLFGSVWQWYFHSVIFLVLVVCGPLRRMAAAGAVIPHTGYTSRLKEEKLFSTATENII